MKYAFLSQPFGLLYPVFHGVHPVEYYRRSLFDLPHHDPEGLEASKYPISTMTLFHGVNVPDSLQPCGVLSMTEMSGLDREDSPHGNATDKIPWYGVYYGLELKKGWGSNLDVVVLTRTDNQRLSGQISSAVSGFWSNRF